MSWKFSGTNKQPSEVLHCLHSNCCPTCKKFPFLRLALTLAFCTITRGVSIYHRNCIFFTHIFKAFLLTWKFPVFQTQNFDLMESAPGDIILNTSCHQCMTHEEVVHVCLATLVLVTWQASTKIGQKSTNRISVIFSAVTLPMQSRLYKWISTHTGSKISFQKNTSQVEASKNIIIACVAVALYL